MRSSAPLRFQLRQSRCAVLFTLALHLLALFVLTQTTLSLLWLLPGALLLCASLFYTLTRLRHGIDVLVYTHQSYSCYAHERRVCSGVALPETVVTPYFILLRLAGSAPRRTHTLLICRDALAPDDYRRLAVMLRLA